jgi:ATP-dependent DNA helicase RecQ
VSVVVSTPMCPDCGAPMRVRTARQGSFAGQTFWGCSRYPQCKTILQYEPSDGTTWAAPGAARSATMNGSIASERLAPAFPVGVTVAPRNQGGQSTIFQACALPSAYVTAIYNGDLEPSVVRTLGQWRLDYPRPAVPRLSESDALLLGIAETLLTRGTLTFCSSSTENLLAVPERIDTQTALAAMKFVTLSPTTAYQARALESEEEQGLFSWVRNVVDEHALPWTLLPQVSLASLAPSLDPATLRRGDLLLVHPLRDPILVEVDGAQHTGHESRDEGRNQALDACGVRVVRITPAEARAACGPTLDALREELISGTTPRPPAEPSQVHTLRWAKTIHQIQIALLRAAQGGWIQLDGTWSVGIVLPSILREDPRACDFAEHAVHDLQELIAHIARLYHRDMPVPSSSVQFLSPRTEPVADALDVLVGPADGSADTVAMEQSCGRFLFSDVAFPGEVRAPLAAARPAVLNSPRREDAEWFLRYIFRKQSFWEGQWETIERALRGLDSVVLLPTGAGKSIAFQLAALLRPGRCIVVDPIVALMEDQVDNLRRVGIDRAVGITRVLGREDRTQVLDLVRTGHYLFSYVAPERFQMTTFRDALRALATSTPISLVAIDEAHCVSEWGHDFRTAYLNLGRIAREYCAYNGAIPPIIALTGTASRIVLKDVQRELGITSFDAIITPKSFDRPELHYTVLHCSSEEKRDRLIGFLQRLPVEFGLDASTFFSGGVPDSQAGLVFCPHTGGAYGVDEQARFLRDKLRTSVGIYCGRAPKSVNPASWDLQKHQTALAFKHDKLTVLACTNAFGMGIDKQNIRFTVHLGLPSSVESFYQEAGRAGRDRLPAECALIFSNDNKNRSRHLLGPDVSLTEIADAVEKAGYRGSDDIDRALYFHVRAFRGEPEELADVRAMIDALGELRAAQLVSVTWSGGAWGSSDDEGQDRAEKALHRLVVLGVVDDYTIDFANREFTVRIAGAVQDDIIEQYSRYVSAYQIRRGEQARHNALALRQDDHRAFVEAMARELIAFIYGSIEQNRRRALNEMVQAASAGRTEADLRKRILEYLTHSEWDDRVEEVRASAKGGMDTLSLVLDDLVSPNDAPELRAAAGRSLGSYADVPGVLLLRALAELMAPDADFLPAQQDITAAISSAIKIYRLSPGDIASGIARALARAEDKAGAADQLLVACLRAPSTDRQLVRALVRRLPAAHRSAPVAYLNDHLAERSAAMRAHTKGALP